MRSVYAERYSPKDARYNEKAFREKIAGNPHLGGYEVVDTISTGEGYQAFAVAKPNPQGGVTYIIVHRGTELSKSNDWDDAGYLGLEKSPDQAVDALAFASKIYQKAGPRDEVINTGHSLGGALATFSHVDLTQAAYGKGESHLWTVAFESPGVGKILLKKGYSPDVVAAAKEKIDILNAFPNAINTAGRHFVTPFAVVTPNNVAGELGAL